MSHHFGLLVLLLSFLLGGYFSASSTDVKDLIQLKCRIAGVDLVENRDRSKKFNYTMAESTCQVLGLQLASKAQVEKARGYGYETCSYGWVSEKVGVIPRIQNNENCGKNKTGVLTWNVELGKTFNAYCFNDSDIRINSCKPELMVTEAPSTVVVMVATSGTATASTSLKKETQTVPTLTSRRHARTTAEASTASSYTTLVTTERSTTQDTTPMMYTEPPEKQKIAQINERVVFGGLPTTLLILALVFFVAAVVLAVCYIKKYKTHLFFTPRKDEKESVEAKVFKDTSGAENTKELERFTNGKESESLQKPTGSCMEVEV